jgi:DNA end-binding protein Ku
MNSIWNPILVINGLLVPVQLFSATQKSKVSFEMIDSRDKAKIRLIRTNELTNQPVPQQYIGKGYQKENERILVPPDLIASCLPPVSNEIVFGYFIDSWELPYTRIDSFYYVLPQVGEEMNYALVLKALIDQNMIGIAQATFQNCCNLFALGSLVDKLVLYRLRFDDQISDIDSPVLPQINSEDDAVMTALKSYMDINCGVFDVSGFRDTFNDSFLAAVAA